MEALNDRLQAWVSAGLITREQADAVADYEGSDQAADAAGIAGRPTSTSGPEPSERAPRSLTGPAEAVGYVGAALALGAVALILGDLWVELLVGGRLALVGLLVVVLSGAGIAVGTSDSPAMQRLTSVLFTGAVAGTGWFAVVVADDVAEWSGAAVGLTVGVAMMAASLPLYLWKHRALLQLAVLVSVLVAAVAALGLSPIAPEPPWFGLVVATIGAVWLALGIGRWLEPRLVAEVGGALTMFVGIQVGSFGSDRVLVVAGGVVVAAGLVGLAVWSDELHHLIIGALALFVLSPQLVFELFGDAIGAPATLLLMGLLLVVLAVGLGRARREVAGNASPERDAGGDGPTGRDATSTIGGSR